MPTPRHQSPFKRHRYYAQPHRNQWRGPAYDLGMPYYVNEFVSDEPDLLVPVGPPSVPIAYADDAADLLPTIVTGDSARSYIDETDAGYRRLNQAIATSPNVPVAFVEQWGIQFAGWNAFAIPTRASVGFFDAKATMEQTDRWARELGAFADSFKASGGTLVGPAPATAGQGIGAPVTLAQLFSGSTGVLVAGAALAAVLILGPRFSK